MNKQKEQSGFTLIEVLMVIVITGIISISIYSVNEAAWEYWNFNQEKLDLKQQARIIMIYLEKDIRNAIAVMVKDIDDDGEEELVLNLGENVGGNDHTDVNTDYYLQYNIRQRCLTLKKPYSSLNTSGISYPDWPATENWSYNRSLTLEIIDDYKFTDINGDGSLVYYQFKLKRGKQTYSFANVVHPRQYQNK